MADDQCNCTTAHIDPNCYCPPDSPKGRASSGGAAAPHALTHSHESLGSFTRNLSAMSLDDARDGEKPPGRVSPDFRGSALTEAAREALLANGHEVRISDLYVMDFDPISDRPNFKGVGDADYLK